MHAVTTVLKNEPCTSIPQYFVNRGVDADQPSIYIERLRMIDHEPVVIDRDFLLTPPIDEIPQKVAENSLYDYIEGELGLDISYASKEITVEKADDEVAAQLKLTGDQLVVVVRSLSFLNDTTLFQLTESYHRPDKFKFSDFARRQKIKLK